MTGRFSDLEIPLLLFALWLLLLASLNSDLQLTLQRCEVCGTFLSPQFVLLISKSFYALPSQPDQTFPTPNPFLICLWTNRKDNIFHTVLATPTHRHHVPSFCINILKSKGMVRLLSPGYPLRSSKKLNWNVGMKIWKMFLLSSEGLL